jgi:hypothetical protein
MGVRNQGKKIEGSVMGGEFNMDVELDKATRNAIWSMLQPKKGERQTTPEFLGFDFLKGPANPMMKSKLEKTLHQ